MHLLFIFTLLGTFLTSTLRRSSVINLESSAFGLRSSCKEELQATLIGYLQSYETENLFYSILKSKYFDYSAVLLSICEFIDDTRLYKIITDLKENHLSEEIIADCICVSAKNGPWKGKLKFPANPLISQHFDSKHWTLNQLKHFNHQAIQDQSIKTRWESFFKNGNQMIFADTWKSVKVTDISTVQQAVFIIKSLLKGEKEITDELLCKIILILGLKRKFPMISGFINSIFDRIKMFISGSETEHLVLFDLITNENFSIFDRKFIEAVLSKIRSISSPAIILNFLELFKDRIESEAQLFYQVLHVFFNPKILTPTITETCVLVQRTNLRRVFSIVNLHLSSKIDLLFGVFNECPQNVPETIIRQYIPLQLRLQKVLKKHRKLVNIEEKTIFKLPKSETGAKEQFNFMIEEIKLLLSKTTISAGFDVYNYPVIEKRAIYNVKKKSFVFAIDRFFAAFLKCEDFYVVLEDGTILPDIINLDPKSLESIGYFLGSALIHQHPIDFRFNEEYFNLLRSSYIPEFHQVLYQLYPMRFRTELSIQILAKQLESGTAYLYSGLARAFEAQYFSINELYQLLFPLII